MKIGNLSKPFEGRRGLTMVDLAMGLVIIGLLVGAILGARDMIKAAKVKRQLSDLLALQAMVENYFDRFSRLPGDLDADGFLDADSAVWTDLKGADLANVARRSPFGARYHFGAGTPSDPAAHREGNYIRISLPPYVAQRIDQQMDDGIDSTGSVTSNSAYLGTARLDVYYFID